ncbi:type VII secretion integral membrane protein EccD [Fodinicola acaciae]|uniref:type VII secretion integral membrane protein EccD n=1 Tax=Fodinicola acaciae TaxID=2681555 RepID=UPI001C9E50FF|nr:type VII secretion integral membrane protein EccD [Fodinicola acaciae]
MPSAGAGLCRVTVVAPKTRIDLALPEDVPLAELVPTLLRYAGEEMAESGWANGGWALSRLGAAPLDTGRSCVQLEIRDGEQLHFTPRSAAPPEAVFDDVVDAIATASNDRGGRWDKQTSRLAGLTAAVVGLVLMAVVITTAGPPQFFGAAIAGFVTIGLIGASAVISRALSDARTGSVLGVMAIPYAFVTGLLALGGSRTLPQLGAPHVLVGFTLMTVVAILVALAVAESVPLFLAIAIASFFGAVGAAFVVLTPASAAGVAAVASAVAMGAAPALPLLSFRLARLPIPTIPTGPEDLKTDTQTVPGAQVLRRSQLADRFFTALLVATALIVGVTEALLVLDGSVYAWSLCAVIAFALLLRARVLRSTSQRLPVLITGLVGLGLLALGAAAGGNLLIRLAVVVTSMLAVVIVILLTGLVLPGRRFSPFWGRALDIIEVLLVVAIVPLVVGVLGLYSYVHGLNG